MADRSRTADYSHLSGSQVKAPTLVDTVADHLRASILAGNFAPGERLFEAALAREFGISRGPIREALALLEGDGLVENQPRRGKFVRALNSRIIDEIYSLRSVLEPYAAELLIQAMTDEIEGSLTDAVETIQSAAATGDISAIARSDLAFHRRLYELTDHRPLQKVWEDIISGSLQMLVNITTPTHQLTDPVRNHEEIVRSIVAGDLEKTREILKLHIEDGWARASSAVKELITQSRE